MDEAVFCKLGVGSGRRRDILTTLRTMLYSGWVVVEQDVLPRGKNAYNRATTDQSRP